jgi:hypothetical protein
MTAQAGSYLGIVFSTKWLSSPGTSRHHITGAHSTPKVRTMKTLAAAAILAMVIVPPALAKARRSQSAPQQGYQSSERPGYYHGYPLKDWYRVDGW